MPLPTPTYNVETEEHVETTIATPAVRFDDKLKAEILNQVHEEGMVILHCTYNAETDGGIRIWISTFLIDKASGDRSKMHHAENISIAPEWTYVPEGKTYRFTLIFAPLPKSCEFFDLLEDIPQAGGFFIQNIKRNKSDVYNVVIL
ncbi:MAG: hypothetical protein Q8M08_12770 [Bacteroidales bacterium]|nr:hypothetical protein [Bacteroidales bacterium]